MCEGNYIYAVSLCNVLVQCTTIQSRRRHERDMYYIALDWVVRAHNIKGTASRCVRITSYWEKGVLHRQFYNPLGHDKDKKFTSHDRITQRNNKMVLAYKHSLETSLSLTKRIISTHGERVFAYIYEMSISNYIISKCKIFGFVWKISLIKCKKPTVYDILYRLLRMMAT